MNQQLPPGWAVVQVQGLFHSFSGGTPSKSNPAYWGGKIPWLSSGDIKSPQVTSASESITRAGLDNSSARLCRPGSVLVVVRSGVLKHTLPVAILEREAAINQDLKCLDSGDDDINKWLELSLRASENDLLALNREGTTVQSVKYETLKEHDLPIPPLAEQQRIVAKLGVLLGKVDACRKRLEKIPVILKRFRQSVLAAACSGRLTADWREESADQEWQETNLGEIAAAFRTGPFGSALHKSDYIKNGIPVINPTNLVDGRIVPSDQVTISQKTFAQLSEYSLRKGDIVIARRGEMGRCAIVTAGEEGWLCGTGSAILRTGRSATPLFLQLVISSPEVRAYLSESSVGTTMDNLNQTLFKAMPLSLPPLPEQHEIVRRVEALFALADKIETRYTKAKTHVDRLTQSILAKAFRGDLVPQDPNDEPATVLLERIRSQRQAAGAPRRQPRRTRVENK